ncbi:hypothetical protein [Jannaschia formosa]|uniref:hypothetical protein n=1 Tax=Jannaschia formosa TaxID=2259592 RepID=UPI00142F63EB|nr:hypothetical protein [Jannaschia formosa]
MLKSALPRNLDLDAMVEILAQSLRDRPASDGCKGATCCGKCEKSLTVDSAGA